MKFKVHQPAQNYLLLDFGNKIDENINKYVLSLAELIKYDGVIEIIPAYSSILIEFDNSNIIPNLSMDKFLIPSYISGESIMNGLILYNKDKTVINTIILPIDELD